MKKFDLKKLYEEIKKDKKVGEKTENKRLSQSQIRKMLSEFGSKESENEKQ
ncbi:MAG: hypothetical protein ACQEQS_02845 [Thermodesulfobacteriota bacterium]